MEHIEGTFKGVRSTDVYYQAWLPSSDIKAVLLIVHGLGEHCGRYINVVNHLVPLGYAVYGFDHVGHGKTSGPTEVIDNFDDLTTNLATFSNLIMNWQLNKPIFLLGHSLGGLIALDHLLDHQADFKGAIFSAPSIKIGDSITKTTLIMAKLLSKLAPQAGVQALDADLISRVPAVVNSYINDPLVFHGKTPARIASESLGAMQRTATKLNGITLPFMVIQGSDDKLVEPAGAQMLFEKAGSLDKTIKLYPGLYHEVFNENERDIVLKDIANWLEAHL